MRLDAQSVDVPSGGSSIREPCEGDGNVQREFYIYLPVECVVATCLHATNPIVFCQCCTLLQHLRYRDCLYPHWLAILPPLHLLGHVRNRHHILFLRRDQTADARRTYGNLPVPETSQDIPPGDRGDGPPWRNHGCG